MVKKFSTFSLLITLLLMSSVFAEQRSSITQYGVTWTFNGQYECGQFVTGDWWVVGPVTINSVSPMQTTGRNGSLLNPMPFRQGYDNRSLASYVYSTEDRVSFPVTLQANNSLVSSVSKPENTTIFKDVGSLYSQAVLTVVSAPVASGTFRPSYCGTYKRYFTTSQLNMGLLPSLPAPASTPSASEVLHYTERPRIDHVCNWLLQHVCAQDNWYNGPNAHNCYAQFYSEIISISAMYAMLDVPDRAEVVRNLVQIGIDNYGVLKAGGGWHSDGGHGSGRKFPVVMAAILLNDPAMLQVGSDYGDYQFGDDAQTYFGVNGKALWGQDDPNDNGCYFLSGCTQSGCRKDERDPAHLQDGCPDYRTYNTSPTWVGQMLGALMIPNAKTVWNHDAYFGYVDRWMTGDVVNGGGTGNSAFVAEMWQLYRNNLPTGGPIVNVTGVSVSPASLTLEEGLSGTLTAIVSPTNASYKTVTWSSNNTSVATVDAYGLVTAISPGSATITATANGGFTDNCSVTVTSIGTNVALLKPITVSSYDIPSAKPGTGLVDGDVSDEARWTASGYPQWAEIDLGADYNITRIDLFPYLNRAYQYTIEGKTQSGTYATIINRSANSEAADNLSDDVSTTARYIKINISGIYGSTTDWVSLAELKVYSDDEITPVSVTGVSVSPTTLSLEQGQSSDLTETVSPSNASNKVVTWLSSNTVIATVNATGLVTAVAEGSANITVTTDDGNYTAVSAITVTSAPDPISVDSVLVSPTSLSLETGQSYELTETVFPLNAANKAVSWSSTNTAVATVNSDGLVSAISGGSANITVTTADGGKTAISSITVTSVPPPTGGYYCDPVNGSMSNNGSASSPWSTLAAVISAGKTFVAGDVIYLKNGNHGWPNITQSNSGVVTIKNYPGHNPVINRLDFNNAANWTIEGIRIYEATAPPETPVLEAPVYGKFENYLVRLTGSTYIIFDNCYVYSIEESSTWTANDWNYKAWCGIYIWHDSHHVTVKNSLLKNLNFALDMSYTNTNTIRYNTIQNFCGDAMRVSPYCVIEYNNILDAYDVNGNHDDAMQAFTSTGAVVRGNIIINSTSERSFMSYGMQGVGFFDGFYDNHLIENNLVVTNSWHGISLYGARNCKIINNTVAANPLGTTTLGPPWIGVFNHKDGTPSSGNVMRNNLTADVYSWAGTSISNNIEISNYSSHFANYEGLDFHLLSSSSAIDAGTSTDAPSTDIDGLSRPQGSGYDVGCYEYSGVFVNETGITVAPTAISVEIGQSTGLTETIAPSNASNKSVTWSSSNTAVAIVNSSGMVTGISLGTATITATTNNLGLTAFSTITVIQPSGDYNIALNKTVTTTADNPPSVGSLLVDGDINDASRWSADGFPQSATIDLGEVCDLSGIYLYTYQDRAYQYTIEASSDGTNYSQIVDRSSNTSDVQPIVDNVSAIGRYVKITVTGAPVYTGTWVSLTELMVMGSPYVGTVNVSSVTVDPISITLDEDETIDLTETVYPLDATDKSVSWTTSNASVATVNSSGLVTAITEGSATITVITNDGDFTAICAVSVTETTTTIDVTGVTVSPTSLSLSEGQTSNLYETVSPANATDVSVVWSSSNTSVATVNTSGLVTAVSAGNATITVTTNDGDFTATSAVTVTAIPTATNVALNKSITVSAYQDDPGFTFPGPNLVDGDVSDATRWAANIFPQWAEIDLGANYDLSSINVFPYQSRAYQYIVEAKTAGGSYSTIVDRSSNTEGADELIDAVSVTARYIKITVSGLYGNTSTWVSLAELEVYGIQAATINVSGVTVSSTSLSLDEGQTSDLDETVTPANADDLSVTWSSNNTSIATVNSSGLVTAVTAGTANITVTTNDGGYTATCVVTVVDPTIYVTGVSISASTLSLDEGQTSDLDETISPANATYPGIVWSSGNTAVATVDANGLVTAVSAGTVTITVTTNDGGYTATCVVTVVDPTIYVSAVSLSASTLSIDEGQTSNLYETISPANATDPSVIWTSNNTSVATVNASGLVTAVSDGNAIITVTTVDGGYTATCAVNVTATNPFANNTTGYWSMDEINAGITPDGSGNDNDGIVTGATSVSGYSANALNFDGANDDVSLGNIDVVPSNGNDGLTLAAWINPDTWVASYYDDRIISKSVGVNEQDHYWMLSAVKSGSLAVLRFRLKTGTTTTTLVASDVGEIPLNQWSHVAATYDGANMKIYLNGTLVGNVAKTGTVATNSTVEATIGVNPDGARPFDGQIDEMYILNKGLTATEINTLMSSGAKSKNSDKALNRYSTPVLILYPNPCTEESFTVDIYGINSEKTIDIQISDISGRIIYSDKIYAKSSRFNSLEINTSNMNYGVYFFKMINGENIAEEKLIIH